MQQFMPIDNANPMPLENAACPLCVLTYAAQLQFAQGLLSRNDLTQLISGVKKYQLFDLPADNEKQNVWQDKTCKIFHTKAAADKKKNEAIFIIPSMINGHQVMDLSSDHSFVNTMAGKGYDVFLFDWGSMTDDPDLKTIDDAVLHKLVSAASYVESLGFKKIHAAGYCMGGTLLSCLAVVMKAKKIAPFSSLTFFAPPWDFDIQEDDVFNALKMAASNARDVIDYRGIWPADWLQRFFVMQDVDKTIRKFVEFSSSDDVQKQKLFVKVERWLNSGTHIPKQIALSCLDDWLSKNALIQKKFKLGDILIDVTHLDMPSCVFYASQDHLVPAGSSLALANAIPGCLSVKVETGHIGMMVSSRAQNHVWLPYQNWLREL